MKARDWIILRCGAKATLALVASLTAAGYEVWTPVERRRMLVGRTRDETFKDIAVLPQIVFAAAESRDDLLSLSRSPNLSYRVWDSDKRRMVTKGHPHFSVFALHGQIRYVTEASLIPLRTLEAGLQKAAALRAQRGMTPPKFNPGEEVQVEGGGMDGLTLVVVSDAKNGIVTVTHPAWMWEVEITAWKLRRVNVEQAPPEQGSALAA